ncbi:Myb-like DNA-binding domain containing protein [Tritrichomonas foetus]|uniref:Myb-like DNA-binding domain containing protein n=1 Tax=Tritrichomonas foetus TaxID=1144522 RepID=A0A1J4KI66_9EUKA|nr:Myb-like DNA-binding domain containing protein [Tritrichomonas foetus]|eukprot:OHT09021.1 Myb-like DNA-binding domain containing protein [Tritrichomonas foetus]
MGRNWEESEDAILKQLVATHGKQWNLIAQHLPKRTASQVAARWEKCLDPNITKGPFTAEEDQMIVDYVSRNGPRGWPRITSILPNRSSKQCRERWFNHLDPNVKKVQWTAEEDNLIFQQHKTIGSKWSTIAKMLPGRTDNAIKNRWNSSISKRIQTDANGNEYVLPDSSRRQYKQKTIPHERPAQLDPAPSNISQMNNNLNIANNALQQNFNSTIKNENANVQNDPNLSNVGMNTLNNQINQMNMGMSLNQPLQNLVSPQKRVDQPPSGDLPKPDLIPETSANPTSTVSSQEILKDINNISIPASNSFSSAGSINRNDNNGSSSGSSNSKVHPPPLQIPDTPTGTSGFGSALPFTPFALPTPCESGLFTPISPIPGFTSTPGAFGGLMSPTQPFDLFSPIKTSTQSNNDAFK